MSGLQNLIRNCFQISPLILSKLKKTIDFLVISGGTEANQFNEIHLILEVKFEEDPLLKCNLVQDYMGGTQPAFTSSKTAMQTPEQCVKCV